MKRILLLILLISFGIKAKSQPNYFSNTIWLNAPLDKELNGKYWEELSDEKGIGFFYTKDSEFAYILDLNTDKTSYYTGWSKRVASSKIQELTFHVLGESVARFSYRNDRSVELMEWTTLPFMHDLWCAKSLLEAERAVMDIKAYVNSSNAESFRDLVKDISISLDKSYKDGLVPLGFNVAYNEQGFITREYITSLSEKGLGSLKEIKCFDYTEILDKSLYGDGDLYVMIAREYRAKTKSLEIINRCSYNEIIIDGLHFSASTYYENASSKAEISAAFEGDLLLNGTYIEYLQRESGNKKPVMRCKMEHVNGLTIGDCDTVKIRKEIMDFFQVYAKSLNKQMSYNSMGLLEKSLNSRLTIDLKDEIYVFPQEDAEFPGGQTAMKNFLSEHVLYPDEAVEQNIQGKVYVKFIVGIDGSVSGVQVERGIYFFQTYQNGKVERKNVECPECEQEAMRAIRMMPKWKPAKMANGKVVPCIQLTAISFNLE